MYAPTPSVPPHSAVTATSSPIEALILTPVAMLGSEAGSDSNESPDGADARRPRDVVQNAVDATGSVERVQEDRPQGGVGDDPAPHRRSEAEEEDGERDQRDRGDRSQELDQDNEASRSARKLPIRTPTTTPTTTAIASPWA